VTDSAVECSWACRMEENPVRTRTPVYLHSSGIGRRQISEGSAAKSGRAVAVNQGRAGTVNQEEQVHTQPQQRKGAHAAWDARTVIFSCRMADSGLDLTQLTRISRFVPGRK
jgi:hypothetical protein